VRYARFSANGWSDYFAIVKENGYPMESTFRESARESHARESSSPHPRSLLLRSIRNEIVSRLPRPSPQPASIAQKNICTFAVYVYTYTYRGG